MKKSLPDCDTVIGVFFIFKKLLKNELLGVIINSPNNFNRFAEDIPLLRVFYTLFWVL